jgi:DNA transformation protein
MQNDLLELKNLGNTSINWLSAIGVNSRQDLEDIGPVKAYLKIKNRDIKVSKVFLYALHAALIDLHWNELDDQTKQQLITAVENHTTPT